MHKQVGMSQDTYIKFVDMKREAVEQGSHVAVIR